MKLLICLAVSTIILTIFDNYFRKYPYIIYLGTFILGLIGSILPNPIASIINRGTLATSLFIIVMYARVLPPKSKLYKTFMSLRAPIAIAASFLILIHNSKTLYSYIKAYILVRAVLKPHEIIAAVCSAIMFLLLILLTITSFKSIRKKMNPKKWKSLQKLSYLFYGLIYVHISCLFGYQILNGRYNYCIELLIYTVIFGVYLFKRIGLYLANTTFKPVSKIFVNTGYFIVASLAIALFSLQYILNNNNHPIVSSEISIDVASKQFDDGEYYGEDMGYNGPISLKLTVSNGKIVDLKFIDYVDEDEYFLPAWESIREQVLTDNDISSLDAVSGATYSSNGIINAINQALYQ